MRSRHQPGEAASTCPPRRQQQSTHAFFSLRAGRPSTIATSRYAIQARPAACTSSTSESNCRRMTIGLPAGGLPESTQFSEGSASGPLGMPRHGSDGVWTYRSSATTARTRARNGPRSPPLRSQTIGIGLRSDCVARRDVRIRGWILRRFGSCGLPLRSPTRRFGGRLTPSDAEGPPGPDEATRRVRRLP